MKTTEKPQTDAQWMALLDTEPDRAMEALVAQYTALICHEAGKYLENPDDVKDCVSETFAEVYTHRDAYDPEKGALSTWIGTIARNRAISAYRKASRVPMGIDADTISDNGDEILDTERAVDVKQAIAQLSETDQQIIRMKYYEDMSIAEIAKSLHIPYETVKKRHTRSIKKLRNSLLTILILAALLVLAACGVIKVLQHFGVLPGYGVTADAPENCYVLAEPVTWQEGPFTIRITDVSLFDDVLTYEYDLEMDKTEYVLPEYDENGEFTMRGLHYATQCCDGTGTPLNTSCTQNMPIDSDEPREFGAAHRTRDTLEPSALQSILGQDPAELNLHISSLSCDGVDYDDILVPFTLLRAKMEELDGYAYLYDEATGGVMLSSTLNGDTLTMNVYPISNGDTEYFMGLTHRIYAMSSEDDPPIAIVDESGNVYEGEYDPFQFFAYPSGGARSATYTFQGVTPGKYTLTLPYVYLAQFPEKAGSLYWNLKDCTFRDKKAKIPGGTLETVSIQPSEPEYEAEREIYDQFWEIRLKAQLDREDMTLVETNYASSPEKKLSTSIRANLARLRKETDSEIYRLGNFGGGCGQLDPDTGELVVRLYASDRHMQYFDYTDTEYCPGTYQLPMCIRYDHPVALEFEVNG